MQALTKHQNRAWIIWMIAGAFYAYEFFIRISPTVMVPELMQDFLVSAISLGSLSAFYYYAYASMQIPVGILLDRFGIQRLLSLAAIMVAAGSLLFALTQALWIAELGRALMGIGSAFSFVACLKLTRNWFPLSQIAIVIGLTNTLGVLGAVVGEAPLSYLIIHNGWRYTMFYAGVLGAILALLISLIVRDKPEKSGLAQENTHEANASFSLWQGLLTIIKNKQTWLTAIYGGLMVAPIAAFAELWGNTFLMRIDHLSKIESALISSMVFVGIAVGGPVTGWWSGFLNRRKPVMFFCACGAFITFLSVLLIQNMPGMLLIFDLFLFGFFTSNMLLIFSINTESYPTWIAGTVIGFTNMIVMLGGTIFQPLVGWLLDWEIVQPFNLLQISVPAFQHALFILPACQLVGILILVFIKETYCRSGNNQAK